MSLAASAMSAAIGERAGYRNGYRPGKVQTAEVAWSTIQRRKFAIRPSPSFERAGRAFGTHARNSNGWRSSFTREALSTRDIEDTFTDEAGRRLLSRAAVSEITEKLWAEYEDFCKRDLSEHAIVYLFIDGIAERLRPGQRREAVLAAWGIGEDGRKSCWG